MTVMSRIWPTLMAGAVGGLITLGASRWMEPAAPALAPTSTALARQVNYGGGPAPFDFTKAAERSMASVVHIKASESRQAATQRMREQRYSDPFSFFFGQGQYEMQPRSGTGSGVIYTSDGYILTNNHVIEFADEFEVTLHDGREFRARLVGRDDDTDMAVIKIDAKDLPAIELTNSDDVRVGEWALAVGNPFDLASTVTAGIVSAKGRNINIIKGRSPIESFIQTDAAVNPGNSGGALVDVNGRLIGINSAIATPTGVFAGYAFAIPSNLAQRIADDLIKYGVFKRGYLGVDIATMDNELAQKLEVPFVQGVWVGKVYDDGSAAKAGIKAEDIITKINGKQVTTVSELREYVSRSKAGEMLNVTVLREGREKDIAVRLDVKSAN